MHSDINNTTKMGFSDEFEDSSHSKHQDLCEKLNMDAAAAEDAWKSYADIRKRYSLEVCLPSFFLVSSCLISYFFIILIHGVNIIFFIELL